MENAPGEAAQEPEHRRSFEKMLQTYIRHLAPLSCFSCYKMCRGLLHQRSQRCLATGRHRDLCRNPHLMLKGKKKNTKQTNTKTNTHFLSLRLLVHLMKWIFLKWNELTISTWTLGQCWSRAALKSDCVKYNTLACTRAGNTSTFSSLLHVHGASLWWSLWPV